VKMFLEDQSTEIPRIGEVVIVACLNSDHWSFLRAVCDHCEMTDQNVILGQSKINEELNLYLYGIHANGNLHDFAWDLLVDKMLGYVVLFDWYNYNDFSQTLETIDFLDERTDAPIVIAADVRDQAFPIASTMFEKAIPISSQGRFTYCRSADPVSVKSVLRILFDMLIDRTV
jgi:hypothetical protein